MGRAFGQRAGHGADQQVIAGQAGGRATSVSLTEVESKRVASIYRLHSRSDSGALCI